MTTFDSKLQEKVSKTHKYSVSGKIVPPQFGILLCKFICWFGPRHQFSANFSSTCLKVSQKNTKCMNRIALLRDCLQKLPCAETGVLNLVAIRLLCSSVDPQRWVCGWGWLSREESRARWLASRPGVSVPKCMV